MDDDARNHNPEDLPLEGLETSDLAMHAYLVEAVSQGAVEDPEAIADMLGIPADDTQLLDRKRAAERLGVHPNTLPSWVSRGWLTVQEDGQYAAKEIEQVRSIIYSEASVVSEDEWRRRQLEAIRTAAPPEGITAADLADSFDELELGE